MRPTLASKLMVGLGPPSPGWNARKTSQHGVIESQMISQMDFSTDVKFNESISQKNKWNLAKLRQPLGSTPDTQATGGIQAARSLQKEKNVFQDPPVIVPCELVVVSGQRSLHFPFKHHQEEAPFNWPLYLVMSKTTKGEIMTTLTFCWSILEKRPKENPYPSSQHGTCGKVPGARSAMKVGERVAFRRCLKTKQKDHDNWCLSVG